MEQIVLTTADTTEQGNNAIDNELSDLMSSKVVLNDTLLPTSPAVSTMNTTTPHAAASIDKVLKILVIGNPKCGKSSIISRYVHQSFDSIYKTTVGADFIRKDISITLHSTPLRVRIQLWDIAGQDRFQKLTRAYFNNAKGVAIVCDVSRDGTVEAVAQWKKEVDGCIQSIDPTASIPVVLFANKADLLEDAITACRTGARMERVCREHGFLGWWITSAKNGECIEEGFHALVSKILEDESENTAPSIAQKAFKLRPNLETMVWDENSLSNVHNDGSCFS